MKAKLLFLIFVFCLSCTNVNKPLTDSDKEKIVGEVKGLVSAVIQVCDNPDPDKLKSMFLDSPDFVSLVGGVYAEYDQSIKNMYSYLGNVKGQKTTISSEKYIVLDASTVLYTANSRCETTLKNDSTIVIDPLGIQFLLKKADNQWKVLSWTEEY